MCDSICILLKKCSLSLLRSVRRLRHHQIGALPTARRADDKRSGGIVRLCVSQGKAAANNK